MKRIKIKVSVVAIAMMLGSCTIMYTPSMQSVPMFKEKGEIHAAGAVRNYQLAYAATDKVGLLFNGFYLKESADFFPDDHNFNRKRESWQFDAAVGRYKIINEHASLEVFGGIGWGHASSTHSTTAFSWGQVPIGGISDFYKCYVQPNYIISNNVAFSTRLEYVNFYNFKEYQGGSVNKTSQLYIYPAITVKAGSRWLYPFAQIQASMPVFRRKYSEYMPDNIIPYISLGLEVHFDKLGNKGKGSR